VLEHGCVAFSFSEKGESPVILRPQRARFFDMRQAAGNGPETAGFSVAEWALQQIATAFDVGCCARLAS
jgi:hypothetical protein